MPAHNQPTRAPARVAIAALVAAAACWGLGTVVSKQVVDDVAPLTLLPIQLAASSVLLLVVTAVRREPIALTPPVRKLAVLGVLNPGAAYALGLVGLTTITASMYVLIWATEPVVILVLAALVLRERISLRLAVLVSVAVAGVLLVVYQPGVSGDLAGILLTTTSVGFCGLYTVLTRRLLLDDASLTVVIAQQAAALVFAVLLASVAELLGTSGWDLSGLSEHVVAPCRGVGRPVLRARFLVLPDRPPARPRLLRSSVPAPDSALRTGWRLSNWRATQLRSNGSGPHQSSSPPSPSPLAKQPIQTQIRDKQHRTSRIRPARRQTRPEEGAPGRIRTYAPASGGRCSIP